MNDTRFKAEQALAPLKKFQHSTVDYVFKRFYEAEDPAKHFLVADEVGLGKTMVARGVIAKTIEHLWDSTERIDILYICSNRAIAAQNIKRLNVLPDRALSLPTRMTLIPLQVKQVKGESGLNNNKVNFISLTPGTTFDLRSATGVICERALVLRMLEGEVPRPRGLHNLLQVGAGVENWNYQVECTTLDGVDERIIERFRRDVKGDTALYEDLVRICEMFRRRRNQYPYEMTQPRNSLIARLRAKLSYACVDALEPDLIILDEFQRFRDLLHGNDDAALLARELFEYSDQNGHSVRTLLLSATPYKMLTLSEDEPEEGNHYQDFLETLEFLYGKEHGLEVISELSREMKNFRDFLQGLPETHSRAVETRSCVESYLRQVMTRTERVSNTVNRDSMVAEPDLSVSVETQDLKQALQVSEVARVLEAPEILEYWKSSPYLLNFMHGYVLKRLLREKADSSSPELVETIRRARSTMLTRGHLDNYKPLDPANGRLRAFMDDVFRNRLEEELWIPPSLPYYGPGRVDPPLTKALIFSSWSMVPDAISALVSYEAERRMGMGPSGSRYFTKKPIRPLQFRRDQGRPATMRAMLLFYPSPTLAAVADPLSIYSTSKQSLSLDDMRATVRQRLKEAINNLGEQTSTDTKADAEEWNAPLAIDVISGSRSIDWLTDPAGLASLSGDSAFQDHVAALQATVEQVPSIPSIEGFLDLLVDFALGSPAVCALRALHRIAPSLRWDDSVLLEAASRIAWGFRTLFNQREAVALLRKDSDDHYWRNVLTYCTGHNLQAVLDEYAHYLVDEQGVMASPPEQRVSSVADAMISALTIRPSQIDVDDIKVRKNKIVIEKLQMRGRFAMRLADYKDEDGTVARFGTVRQAFNSPFRPFVLATTSVGQEGLDFHPYCYRVYHWNLPGNPVDLEQREGRVHRYKGHAIRLNLAEKQAEVLTNSTDADPWNAMFREARSKTNNETDLVPYWLYEGSVKVERRVPLLPFSREVTRLDWLKRSLTVYRLAFGQPRQDDLLNYLINQFIK